MTISYGKQSVNTDDIKSVIKSLRSNNLTQGPLVKKFESELCKTFKSKYSSVLSNGSNALHLVGRILNWKKGDIIAVSPLTFLSSVNCVEHCNATPKFIDINLTDYCMDPEMLELELKKDKKKKIKAAIITDYGGQPANWVKFKKLKKKFNIILINDNCHAMGSSINKDKGYAVKFADIVTLSFHPVKAITTGEGGAILTNHKKFNTKIKLLREHGIERNNYLHWKYKVNELGYNYRLPDINCALGISQLKKLNKFVSKRKKIAKIYDKHFEGKKEFIVPKKIFNSENSYHLYPLLLNLDKIKKTKDMVLREFLRHGIKLQVHYIPVNIQPYYKKKYGFSKKNFKNTMSFFKRCVSLPVFYELNLSKIIYIKKICNKVFKNHQ
tara:strand:- start:15665 stop:16813 length:1149 start_codon:yes stop_codon:yes gene_type:complete